MSHQFSTRSQGKMAPNYVEARSAPTLEVRQVAILKFQQRSEGNCELSEWAKFWCQHYVKNGQSTIEMVGNVMVNGPSQCHPSGRPTDSGLFQRALLGPLCGSLVSCSLLFWTLYRLHVSHECNRILTKCNQYRCNYLIIFLIKHVS